MADVITRLKLESSEYDSKIKRATQGLLQMEQECRKVGGTLAILEKDQLEFVKGLGHMETVSKSARGKLSELTQAYTELAMQYKRLTDEEKKGDFGKALSSSLDQLKGRINDTQKQLADVNKELGTASKEGMDFSSVLNAMGGQLGINTQLMTAVTGGTMGYVAAIVGVSTAVLAATKALIDYNTEMQRQNNVTSVVTGLSGTDAEELTAGIKALSDTYNVDFREAVEAANTLIHQFGLSGKEALDLLQDGMQGMIQGDGGKLLQMIQQYAPSFRDAGISASQLVAIIHNSEGGLFTDQNMNAIVMGIKNIRLMTKQTSDALNQLGIDGDEMSKKLDDGSMTVFDALRQVADKIDEVGSGSKAAGEVMQAVFGRQGTMAGTKLGEAIATLNLNLEETRTQTGELGASFVDLQDANRRLDTAMQGFLGNTVGWDEMNNTIKSGLLNSLAAVIEDVNTLKTAIGGLDASSDSFKNLADAIDNTLISKLSTAVFLASQLRKLIQEMKGESGGQSGKSSGGGKGKGSSTPKDGTYWEKTDASGNIIAAGIYKGGKQYQTTGPEVVVTPDTKPTKNKPKSGRTSVKKNTPKWSSIEVGEMAGLDVATLGRSYSDINKDMSAAKKQYEEAGDMFARAAAAKLIEELGIEKTTMQAMEDPMAEANKHNFQKDLDAYNKEHNKEKKEDEKDKKSVAEGLGQLGSGLSGLQSGFESLGIDLGDGFGSVVNSLSGISSILMAIQTIVSAIQVISAADSIIPFAKGGIVPHAATGMLIPGNDHADRTLIAASSGELILNEAQQGVLAAELQERKNGGYQGTPYVDGERIFLGLNNFLRRSGRGEIVTSR